MNIIHRFVMLSHVSSPHVSFVRLSLSYLQRQQLLFMDLIIHIWINFPERDHEAPPGSVAPSELRPDCR